jgi:hypothetical protein
MPSCPRPKHDSVPEMHAAVASLDAHLAERSTKRANRTLVCAAFALASAHPSEHPETVRALREAVRR